MVMDKTYKILLVEDESSVAEFIRKGLFEQNHEVSLAMDGISALEMIQSQNFDLIILDIMLPGKNGIEVCREIRLRDNKLPVLFLTALGTAENIALGLNTGADDYIVKPFKFIELNARINAILRRSSHTDETGAGKNDDVFTAFDLLVNDNAKTVQRNGVNITLTATEYKLLLALIRNKNKVMSRLELLESAWDINFNLGTNVVDVYVNYLRNKLDAGHDNKLIHTIIGMGYVLKDK